MIKLDSYKEKIKGKVKEKSSFLFKSKKSEKGKVLFVEPRGAYASVFDKYITTPLLGPLYLGTIAKQRGYDASIHNENIIGDIKDQDLASVDYLCIDALTPTSTRGKEIAQEYRKIRKEKGLESKVLFGGVHASMVPQDVVDYADKVIVGEGEKVIIPLLEGKIKDKIVYAPQVENLDELPIPDFNLIKESKKIRVYPIMTSRGCKKNCDFCSVTKMYGRAYRSQSPERVLKEVIAINNYTKGKKRLFFADDTLAEDPNRLEKILDLIIDSGIKIKWSAQVNALIHRQPQIIEKMKKAGCEDVYIGFESVNPDTLKERRKSQKVSDIVESTKMLHDYGIGVCGMTMFGSDSDDKDIFKRTVDFYKKINLDYFQGTSVTPYPGTDWYKKLKAEDSKGEGHKENSKSRVLFEDKFHRWTGQLVVHKPAKMTPYELQQGIIYTYLQLYSTKEALRTLTKYIAGKLKLTKERVPSFNVVKIKFAARYIAKDWIKHNRDFLKELERMHATRNFQSFARYIGVS